MRSLFRFVSLALIAAPLPVLAQITPQEHTVQESQPGKVTRTGSVRASVAVTAIDKATRQLTLKNATGQTFDIVAGSEVRNFEQIRVGDEVNVEYVRSLTLELKKAGASAPSAAEVVARAPVGEKPGGFVAQQVTVVAKVTAVDPAAKTITLQGPKGNIVELDVKNPDQFRVVKVGDNVEVTYSQAVAIDVQPTAKNPKN